MPEKFNNPFHFWQELKRRKVIRVITVYAAAAFVIIELTNNITEPLSLPEWVPTLVIVLLAIGFLISIVMSWIFDITPEGVIKTKSVKKDQKTEKPVASNGWKIATGVSIVVIIGLVIFNVVGDKTKTKNIAGLEKSIAVLPFENWNSDEEYAHMGDAIANEINTQLAKIKEFHIFSYTSSSQYKGSDKPSITQIGKELGANFIIEGTIERQKEEVSIHVQVIQAKNDDHIWAHEFKDKWNNIFIIRSEIALRIAEELKAALSTEEIEKLEIKPTENVEAYDLYMKGRYYWNSRTKEGVMKSIEYFKQAIELDNEYALAYSGLADAYHILGDWYYMDPDSALKKARLFAFQSILIDNEIAEPYATLGNIFWQMSFEYELAELMYKHSLQINPYYSSANQCYALFLTSLGRFKEAFNYLDIAFNLDPESAIINYASGFIYYLAEEYDKALFKFNQTFRIAQNFYYEYYPFACYLQKGLYTEAISEYEKTLSGIPIGEGFHQDAIQILGNKGADELMRYIIKLEIQKENPDRLLLPALYAFIGENEQALDILESNVNDKITDFLFINVEPAYKNLHSESRFIELLGKLGMENK